VSRSPERVPRLALGLDEAAAAINLSRDGFERYVLAELRVVRVGRRIVVPIRELEKWIDRHANVPLEGELR